MRSTHDTPHLHHDPLTARTVFVAPGRAQRPNELEGATIRCPFCAGNESLTPPALLRSPRSAAEPWRARIVPNQFPIVTDTAGGPAGEAGEVHQTAAQTSTQPSSQTSAQRPAHGVHEVVIESPEHMRSILAIDPADWQEVWKLCRERLATLADQRGLTWATVFKNSGARAGASLEHVHSQLVALDFVPPAILAELSVAGRTADPFGDLLRLAAAENRIVEQAGDLVALVPPAPRQPFEAWILPLTAERYFHATSPDRVAALAALTQSVIGRLARLLPESDYNWWLHQPPYAHAVASHLDAPVPARWHWHLEIMPRINGLAGFELGAGCHITTATPQDSARRLRDA